ncbi:hypothetical protein P3S67_026537 [Capsicum chacoense]
MFPSTFSAGPPSVASSSTFSLPPSAAGDGYFNYDIAWYGNIQYLLCAKKEGHGRREMAEIRSSRFVAPASKSDVKTLNFIIAPAMPSF